MVDRHREAAGATHDEERGVALRGALPAGDAANVATLPNTADVVVELDDAHAVAGLRFAGRG